MSYDDFGEIDNDDLLYDNNKKKNNPIKKPRHQEEDEFEYFDDENNNQKKPLELPRIENNRSFNNISAQQNSKSQKKDQSYQELEVLDNKKQNEKKVVPHPTQQQNHNHMSDEDIYEDESRITNSKRHNGKEPKEIDEDLDDLGINNNEEEVEDGGSQYEDYEYEDEDVKKHPPKQHQDDDDDDEPYYEEDYEDNDFDVENQEEFDDQPSKFEDDQSKISDYRSKAQQGKNRTKQSKSSNRPPMYKNNKAPPKETYMSKYASIVADVNYSKLSDKQLMKENNDLRQKLKDISEEVTKLVEKAASRPRQQEKQQVSVTYKIKILKEELKNNQKRLEPQQAEINKIRTRMEQVSSPKYFTDLTKDIEKVQKQIDDKKKKNKQDQLEQNKKGKNLDQIENVVGNPQNLVEKQKKAIDLDFLERRNTTLQEQIAKVRIDINENQQKQPKISQILQEKIDQAVKFRIDIDPDQQMTKLREKYFQLEKKKVNLEKHIEMFKLKEGKVWAAEHEIKELKKLIQFKNNDINMIEMQIFEQRRQVEEAKNKFPENKFKLFQAAAFTQQNYNIPAPDLEIQKNARKLASAKPTPAQEIPYQQPQVPKQIEERINIQQQMNDQPANIKKDFTIGQPKPMSVEPFRLNRMMKNPIQEQIDTYEPSVQNKQVQLDKKPTTPEKNKNQPFVIGGTELNNNDKNEKQINLKVNQQGQVQQQPLTLNNKSPSPEVKQPEQKQFNFNKNQKVGDSQQQPNPPQQQQQQQQQQSSQDYQSSIQTVNRNQLPTGTDKQKQVDNSILSQQQQTSQQTIVVNNDSSIGYGMTQPGEQQPSRRNRMMKNQDQSDAYQPSVKTQQVQQEKKPPTPVPQSNQIEAYVIGGGNARRNRNGQISNDSKLSNDKLDTSVLPQNNNINDLIMNNNDQVEQKQPEQKQFNFNKNQKAVDQSPQLQLQPQQQEQQVQPQQNNQQVAGGGRRQKNGPRKLDIWSDDHQEVQTDFQNIKTIDEPIQKPQQQQQQKIIYEEPSQYNEPDREMTLDEILGGGQEKNNNYNKNKIEPVPEETYKSKREQQKPVQTQAQRQKELADKAENEDIFGDYEV